MLHRIQTSSNVPHRPWRFQYFTISGGQRPQRHVQSLSVLAFNTSHQPLKQKKLLCCPYDSTLSIIKRHFTGFVGSMSVKPDVYTFSDTATSTQSTGGVDEPPSTNAAAPPPVPDIIALSEKYKVWHAPISEKPALFQLCLAPYYLPMSVCRTLSLLGNVHSTLGHDTKHILLASPHPGSTALLSEAVEAMAMDIGADLQSLDYQTILAATQEIGVRQVSWGSDECLRRLEKPELLKVSPSFSPANYDTALLGDDADLDEEEADFDGEEADPDEEDLGNSSHQSSSDSSIFRHAIFSNPEVVQSAQSQLVFKVNVVQDDTHKSTRSAALSDSNDVAQSTSSNVATDIDAPSRTAASPVLRITNVSIQPEELDNNRYDFHSSFSNAMHKALALSRKLTSKETHYDIGLRNVQIQSFLGSMRDSIIQRFKTYSADPLCKHRKLVIFLKDTTDMLESGGVDGRKVLLGLMDLVLSLRRDHNIPVLFVSGCSPALAHTPNVEKNASFYTSLFEGSATLMNKGSDNIHSNIWKIGKLYETPLDHTGNQFEKVEILPPCPMSTRIEVENQKSAWVTGRSTFSTPNPQKATSFIFNEHQPSATDKELLQGLEHIASHVDALQDSLYSRLRSINWRNIIFVCAQKNIIIGGLDSAKMADLDDPMLKHQITPQILQKILSILDSHVWPMARIEKLVSLSIGRQIESQFGRGESVQHRVKLPVIHIFEALQMMQQSDIVRSSRDNTTDLTKAGSQSKGSFKFGVSSKSTDENSENDNSTSSASPKQEQSDSAQLHEFLKREGHRINSYEKKILSTVVNPVNIKIGFSDLILPPATKLMLQTLITLPMLRPEFFAKGILSRSAINGVLLFGPPGTGKTMLAKAVAKSSGAKFMNVALSNVLDKYVGEGEKNVRAVFTLARKLAPCVVFLDEVDALFAARRNDGSSSSRREIMNEFMAEWDGLSSNNNGVIVLGATNRPFDLDDAILRRMPRRILIDLPSEEARASILTRLLMDELLDSSVDIPFLAKRTALYSGSDLKNLCIAAALARVKESVVRSLLQTDSNTTVTAEHVRTHLDSLDDWAKCLGTEQAKKSSVSQNKPAVDSVKTGSSTHGRRQRSFHILQANTVPFFKPSVAEEPLDVSTSNDIPIAAKQSSNDTNGNLPKSKKTGEHFSQESEPLTSAHFEVAFAEVPPSLTDEMQTLVELRKWDKQFGDGSARHNAKKTRGWGFDFVDSGKHVSPTPGV
ncbi:hypothetical protein BDV3_000057 [Batrachochytrium dendrobatidis]